MEHDNTNRGVLFKNDKKTEEKHPDYTGSYMDSSGADHWLDAWLAKDRNGKTYMRLKTKLKDDVHKQGMQQARQAMQPKELADDSDLPF
jgi:hypothetical protein